MANWIATPVDEGFDAYRNGAQECECPYSPGLAEADKWRTGWQSARQKLGGSPFAGTAFETQWERLTRNT